MGRCYYYGKNQSDIRAFQKDVAQDLSEKNDEVKRIIIDDNTELVIEKDTIYEIDRNCEKCLKNKDILR